MARTRHRKPQTLNPPDIHVPTMYRGQQGRAGSSSRRSSVDLSVQVGVRNPILAGNRRWPPPRRRPAAKALWRARGRASPLPSSYTTSRDTTRPAPVRRAPLWGLGPDRSGSGRCRTPTIRASVRLPGRASPCGSGSNREMAPVTACSTAGWCQSGRVPAVGADVAWAERRFMPLQHFLETDALVSDLAPKPSIVRSPS